MSRIGNRILQIPANVNVILDNNNLLTVEGPKGKLVRNFPKQITININEKVITTIRSNDEKKNKQLHGTTNSLINGMLKGVSEGFEKQLEFFSDGYNIAIEGKKLILKLGYSHPTVYQIPENIEISAAKISKDKNLMKINGFDKQLVGMVAAQIRDYRKPEPYKGKGIRYKDEIIRRKEGKSSAKGK